MHCCKQINSYIFFKKVLTSAKLLCIINLAFADVAHPVERNLAKVEVASSSLVIRSKTKAPFLWCFLFFIRNEARKEQSVRIATVRWTVAVLGCVPKRALALDGRASSSAPKQKHHFYGAFCFS